MGLFRSLGGQMTLEKTDAIVYLAVAYLFYALYFFLFTVHGWRDPGNAASAASPSSVSMAVFRTRGSSFGAISATCFPEPR